VGCVRVFKLEMRARAEATSVMNVSFFMRGFYLYRGGL
jgi:hypothetical protein